MSDYIFIELPAQPRSKLPPPEFPFPIRSEILLQQDLRRMLLEDFLEELSIFLDENPNRIGRYRESGAAYAKWAALDLATDGMIEPALRMFELCLRLTPGDHDARLAYAVALHSREHRAEALNQYGILMSDAPVEKYWRAWMLAAEAHAALGEDAAALGIMEQAVSAWPEDNRFWGFLGELQDRSEPPAAKTCSSCGAELPKDSRFCGHCGALCAS